MTNGTLKEFNATELMNKVYERQTAVHTKREHDGKIYLICVSGHECFMTLDGSETWDIDIIVVDAEGKQERIGTYKDMSDLTREETIAKMEAMVKEIIGEEKENKKMTKARVENWFRLDESTKLEDQAKHFIASTVEGYLNGIEFGYEPMTREQWKQYIIDGLNMEINAGMIVNGVERCHLRFLGNERFHELIDIFLDNYKSVQKYIIG